MKTLLAILACALPCALLAGCNSGSGTAQAAEIEKVAAPAIDVSEASTGTAPTEVCDPDAGTVARASFKTLDDVWAWYESFTVNQVPPPSAQTTCVQILYIAPSTEVLSWWYVELLIELE